MEKMGFGGGCHWCTEAVFQSIEGVGNVDQGWIASSGKYSSFSEAVLVDFDPQIISLHQLIKSHLLTHSCTSEHSMREKYRSAIYVFSHEQHEIVQKNLEDLQQLWSGNIITQILPFVSFRRNSADLLNYYQSRPDAPFCQKYIQPKLKLLKKNQKADKG
ncbi:peptide-methionine (S)-S-oxide reductase [Echinicola sp. CAU 1574]|uniref:peptide-methionine (S)-S-oxide reductase n=2 Tax=Echinicola arenosa TaxID=2774144 RepID=A0ABR9ALD8_9BACT|nr:peptide-methionine (S)-S-oxide reductase [Echinicola arenosa]